MNTIKLLINLSNEIRDLSEKIKDITQDVNMQNYQNKRSRIQAIKNDYQQLIKDTKQSLKKIQQARDIPVYNISDIMENKIPAYRQEQKRQINNNYTKNNIDYDGVGELLDEKYHPIYASDVFKWGMERVEQSPIVIYFVYEQIINGKQIQLPYKIRKFSDVISVYQAMLDFINRGSGIEDPVVVRYRISPVHIYEDEIDKQFQQKLQNKIPIKKSKKGRGFTQDCEQDYVIVNNEFLYVPTSQMCLVKCFNYICGYDTTQLIQKNIDDHKKSSKSKLNYNIENIPQTRVNKIIDYLNIDCVVVTRAQNLVGKHQFGIYNHNGHYVVLKNGITSKQFNSIPQFIQIENKYIAKQEDFQMIKNPKINHIPYNIIQKQMWIYDLETYVDQNGYIIPYACGLMKFDAIDDILKLKPNDRTIQLYVEIFTADNGCVIEQMFSYLDDFYSKKQNQHNGKAQKVYLYAHNGSGFDSHVVLQQNTKREITNIVKSGSRILQLCVGNYSLQCTLSHLIMPLSVLCSKQGYNIPSHLVKQSCDVCSITEQNWKQNIDMWYTYLKYDCISLACVWKKYIDALHELSPNFNILKKLSAAGVAWGLFLEQYQKDLCIDTNIKIDTHDFEKQVYNQMVQKNAGFILKPGSQEYTQLKQDIIKQLRKQNIIDQRHALQQEINKQFSDKTQLYQYNDYQCVNMIRKSVHGGRVMACKQLQFETNDDIDFCLQKVYGTTSLDYIIQNQNKESQERLKMLTNNFNDQLIPFDATSLYPSAMVMDVTFPDIRSMISIQNESIDEVNKKYKHYIINCDVYIPQDCKFIPIPSKLTEKQYYKMINHQETGTDTIGCYYLSGNIKNQWYGDVDISQLYRIGGYVTKIHQGQGFTQCIKNPFKNFINNLFQLRLKYKKEGNSAEQVVKLILNSTYGKTVQKLISTNISITSESQFFEKKYTENVIKATQLNNGQVIYEEDLDLEQQLQNQFPSILGCYILQYSKVIMNNFIEAIDGFKQSKVYYTDTDSIYIHKSDMDLLQQRGCVGSNMGQGKNDYESGGIIRAFFLGPKQKVCYTLSNGKIEKHITFKGIYKNIDMINGYKIQKQSVEQIITEDSVNDIINNGMQLGSSNQIQKNIWQSQVNNIDLEKGSLKKGIFQDSCFRTLNFNSQRLKMNVEGNNYSFIHIK